MKFIPTAVLVFILLVIGLAVAGWYVTSTTSERPTAASAPAVQQAGEAHAGRGTIRVDNVARMTVRLWSAPAWGTDESPEGNPLSSLAQGTPVQITRRAEDPATGRLSYLVRTEGTQGWIAAENLAIDERR